MVYTRSIRLGRVKGPGAVQLCEKKKNSHLISDMKLHFFIRSFAYSSLNIYAQPGILPSQDSLIESLKKYVANK